MLPPRTSGRSCTANERKHYVICDREGRVRYDFYCKNKDDALYEAKSLSNKRNEKIMARKVVMVDVSEFENGDSEYFYS